MGSDVSASGEERQLIEKLTLGPDRGKDRDRWQLLSGSRIEDLVDLCCTHVPTNAPSSSRLLFAND